MASTIGNILVTGGAGYIGSHVVKLLLEKRAGNVVVLDTLERGNREAIVGGEFIQGDVGNKNIVCGILKKYNIGVVMHLAGYIQVGESQEKPELYMENNVHKGIVLLDAMRECGVKNIIFSSSAAVYGVPRASRISEDHLREPINTYGKTKLLFEDTLKEYSKNDGFRCIALRYFNVAGADPEGVLGEWHKPETHIIPLILTAIGKDGTFLLYGDDYDTPDGTCIRDYIHVFDVSKANIAAVSYIVSKPEGFHDAFNIGSGKGVSIRELLKKCEKVVGKAPQTEVKKKRSGDPGVLVANRDKAMRLLGWQPRYSIEDIISHAWQALIR